MKIMIFPSGIAGFLSFATGCVYLVYKLLYWDTFSVSIAPLIIVFSFISSIHNLFYGLWENTYSPDWTRANSQSM